MAFNPTTHEFVGMIQDVLGFVPSALTDKDNAFVRIEWTGEALEISALNKTFGGIATWTPPPAIVAAGGLDDPWNVLLSKADAKHLIATFKLASGLGETPVSVDFREGGIVVHRASDGEGGADPRVHYKGHLEPVTSVREAFKGVGEVDREESVVTDPAGHVAVGAVAKRRYELVHLVPHERASVAYVGHGFVAYFAHPHDEPDTTYETAAHADIPG